MILGTGFLRLFDYPFTWRALLEVIFLGVSGGMLGSVMLLRRMALVADAISHGLLPGIALAYLLFGAGLWSMFSGALFAGLILAVLAGLISRLSRLKDEMAFGALFILLFGLGVVLISMSDTKIDLLHFLFGDILAVGNRDLWISAAGSSAVVLFFAVFYRGMVLETFDPVFHRSVNGRGAALHLVFLFLTVVNIVAALQAMGIVLALGLFLLPATTAYLWCNRFGVMLIASALIAVAGSIAGFLLSFQFGWASGASMVVTLGAMFLFSVLFAPQYGIIFSRFRRSSRHLNERGEAFCDID